MNIVRVFSIVVVVVVAASVSHADFIAYNDCRLPNEGAHTNPANTTLWGWGVGSTGTMGQLKDFGTGIDTSVTVEMVENGATESSGGTGGPMPNAGTDAHTIFDGMVDIAHPLIYYGENEGWWVDMRFSGLDASKKYTLATTLNRGNYDNRWSVVSISDADAYTYAASAGAHKIDDAALSIPSLNTDTGYVAKWTDISAGDDGGFTVRFTHATAANGGIPPNESQDGRKAYGPACFMLQEVPEPSTIVLAAMGLLFCLIGWARRRSA